MAAVEQGGSRRDFNLLAWLRDIRVLQVIGQIVFVVVVLFVLSQLLGTASHEMTARGLAPNFSFLDSRAGFSISESPAWYGGDSSYGQALQVGMTNTLRVVSLGLILTTIIGILFGIFLLSTNWLVRTISRVYVEVLRNTPLLVQLFVWYYIIIFSLPAIQDAIRLPSEGVTHLSLRVFIYVILYFIVRRYTGRMKRESPRRPLISYGAVAVFVMTELLFALYRSNPEGVFLAYGSGSIANMGFLAYVFLSVLLFVVIGYFGIAILRSTGTGQRVPNSLRPVLMGLLGGQFIAGLLFYFGVMPNSSLRIETYPAIYVSIRGFTFPEILSTGRTVEWLAIVGLGVLLAIFMWIWFGQVIENTGRRVPRGLYALVAILGFAIAGWFLVGIEPAPQTIPIEQDGATVMMPLADAQANNLLTTDDLQQYSTIPLLFLTPQQNRFGVFLVGSEVSPEYMALLLALVIYTSAFIAEIVRAGIQAVPYGQVEAARALGLSQTMTLTRIVLPQALRVIIPPLGNQYLNLAKNSSLAIAIAFSDAFAVATTVMNQSGQTVTTFLLIMLFYLIMSLVISGVMNWVNSRFQLVTR